MEVRVTEEEVEARGILCSWGMEGAEDEVLMGVVFWLAG